MKHIKLLTYIAITDIALLGAYDIGADALDGKLTWQHFAFNFLFFIPLIFRHRLVYGIFGVWFTILFGYLLLGGLYLVAAGKVGNVSKLEIICVATYFAFSLLCSLFLVYVGVIGKNKEHAVIA